MSEEPQTPADWQECVDAAQFFLALDSARQFGLVIGGPVADVDRCIEMLARDKALGFMPADVGALCHKYLHGEKTA